MHVNYTKIIQSFRKIMQEASLSTKAWAAIHIFSYIK